MGGSLLIKKFSLQIFRVLDGLFGHIFLKIPGKGGGEVCNPKRFIADFEKVSKKLQYKTVKVQWRGSTLFEKFPKIYPI